MAPTLVAPKPHTQSTIVAANSVWRWLMALAVCGTIFLVQQSAVRPFSGQLMGKILAKYPTLLTPASYAFGIWALIFIALAVYTAWQLLPASQRFAVPDAVAKPLLLASVAVGIKVVLLGHDSVLLSLGLTLLTLGSVAVAYGRVRQQVFAKDVPAVVGVPFSLFLGWSSVAAVLNLTVALQQLGWQADEGTSISLTVLLLMFLVGLALTVSRLFRDMVFPLVVAWALAAVWVARLNATPALGWAALAFAAVAAIGGLLQAWLGSRKDPLQLRDEAAAAAEAEIAARKAALSI